MSKRPIFFLIYGVCINLEEAKISQLTEEAKNFIKEEYIRYYNQFDENNILCCGYMKAICREFKIGLWLRNKYFIGLQLGRMEFDQTRRQFKDSVEKQLKNIFIPESEIFKTFGMYEDYV
jgi:hypothetical protein